MEKKGMIILGIFLLILIPLINAVPPFQEGSTVFTAGYNVEYTKLDYYKINEDILFNCHVFNISNGLMITNETTNCFFHLFNSSGNHIIDQHPMDYHSSGYDWEYLVKGSNFSTVGNYAFSITCNSSDFGGFISFGFEVTPSGRAAPNSGEGTIFLASIISMILMTILFFAFSFTVEKGSGLRFGFLAISLVMSVITTLYSSVSLMEVYGGFSRTLRSFTIFQYIVLSVLVIIFIFVLVSLIVEGLNAWQIKKGLKDENP